jgi:uncharacterized membrane-anchored protein YhcB (DUF1043 family)
MDTPQVDDFLVWFAGVVTALVVIVGGIVALRKLLLGAIDKRLDAIDSQLHRNGGTSLRDAVDRIEERQTDIQSHVRRTADRLDEHIDWHLDKESK